MRSPTAAANDAGPDARTAGRHNIVGISAMLTAMAAFVFNDAFAKLVSADLPLGQILVARNAYIVVVVAVLLWTLGYLNRIRGLLIAPVGFRMVGEVFSTPLYLLALFNLPIANVTAILQMLPLVMTIAAAVIFREHVGPRRWAAAIIGLVGVLMIVQPGTDGFDLWSLSAVGAVFFITLRDVSTRRIPQELPALLIAGSTSAVVMLLGMALYPFETWGTITPRHALLLVGSGTCLLVAYTAITVAMRTGELSLVGLFRYSIVLWAIALGYFIWGEMPDPMALFGTALVVMTGAYTVYRERAARRDARA